MRSPLLTPIATLSAATLLLTHGCAAGGVAADPSAPALPLARDAAIDGTLFVSDFYSADVLLYREQLQNPAPFGKISEGLSNSYNLFVDQRGTLYVQGNNNTITEFPKGRKKPHKVLNEPPAGPGGYGTGVSLAVGSDGTVYAVDPYGSQLYEFANGSTSPTTTIGISHPYGLALDSKNDLYVGYTYSSSGFNARVMEYAPGQTTGKDLGIEVKLGGGLNVDVHDNLLVGDQGTQLIDVFRPGSKRPFRQIDTAPNYPYQFAFSRSEHRLYLVSGTPAAVYVYDYKTGKLLRSDTQGLSPSGYALGVAVEPAAPW